MPPKVEAWSNEAETLLIDAVQCRPMLWDCTLADYRINDLKERQWEEIASLLSSPFTVEEVKERFSNMKGTFQDNERRVKDSKRSGCGSDSVFRSRWHLFERLLFRRKTFASSSSDSNITITENDLVPVTFVIIQDSMSQSTSSVHSFITNSPLASPAVQSSVSMSRPASAPPSSDTNKRASDDNDLFVKRGAKKKKVGSALEPAVNAIKDIDATPDVVPAPPNQQDSVDAFLNFLGSKLRGMDEATRKECEQEIVTYILSKV